MKIKLSARIIFAFLIATIFYSNQPAQAFEITSSQSKNVGKRFLIDVSAHVKVQPEQVLAILTNYDNLAQVNHNIISSQIISQNQNGTIVKTVIKGCVWFFCKEVVNTQEVEVSNTTISAVTLPKQSDFKNAKMVWKIKKSKDGTEINYYAEIEPTFFVPPIIGTFFIKNTLLKEAVDSIRNIENSAQRK